MAADGMTTLTRSKVWRPNYRPKLAPYGYNESDIRLSIERTSQEPNVDHATLTVCVGPKTNYVQLDIHPADFDGLVALMMRANPEATFAAFAKAVLANQRS